MIGSKTVLAAIAAGALALTGCGGGKDGSDGDAKETKSDVTAKSPANKIADAYIGEMTKIADALETVNDEESARAAASVIQKAGLKLEAMQDELEGEMSDRKWATIVMSRQQEWAQLQTRLGMSMGRIGMTQPELMQIISEEMDKLPQSDN